MGNFNFNKYKKGIMTIEIQSITPEKFINLLWKNSIYVKNIKRKNITTICIDINLKDYDKINAISKRTNTKIKIIDRRGISFFMIKIKKRKTLVGGAIIFAIIIYCLSTFIWSIEIITEQNITPYEIRNQLKTFGITQGVNKNKIDVYDIEDKIVKYNKDIMWARARIEGGKLKINIVERHQPPQIVIDNSYCDIVAKKDGEIVRVYTTAGTAVVKKGDIVKKGDLLVKGEQGKEESLYKVHAEADVIARTFYEKIGEVSTRKVKRERTGNKLVNIYCQVLDKKIYLKKSENKFKIYDKIVIDKPLIKQEIYYEVNEQIDTPNKEKLIQRTAEELFSKIIVKLDKSVKIIDKIVDVKAKEENYEVRVVLIVEEDIAEPKKIEMDDEFTEDI